MVEADYKWAECLFHGKRCVVDSEKKALRVTIAPDTPQEFIIFDQDINIKRDKKHRFTMTWTQDRMSLFVNSKRVAMGLF